MTIEEILEYKTGDWVKLKVEDGLGYESLIPYLGQIVRINATDGRGFSFNKPEGGCSTRYSMYIIERIGTNEEIKRVKREGKRLKEEYTLLIAKEKEGIIYKEEDVYRIAEDIFGIDRVRIGDRSVMIHFPHLHVTNDKGQEHDVKDLYVEFCIKPRILEDDWKIGGYKAEIRMMGLRGTLSLKEYESNYGFSHLNIGNVEWRNFCVGKSEFSILLQNLQLSLLEEDWNMVFLALENYLTWESLEGGPYIKIENLRYKKNINGRLIHAELERLLPDMPRDVWDITDDSISLIQETPVLREYFNSTSKIRDVNTYSREEADVAIKDGIQFLREKRKKHNAEIIWGDEKREVEIYHEETNENDSKPISKGILESYYNILQEKGKEFIKKYTYGRAKQEHREKVFGASGARQ